MMRRPVIAANWKMNMLPGETTDFVASFLPLLPADLHSEVVLCAPFTSLGAASAALQGDSRVALGAQDISQHQAGAYTGEVSADMLKAVPVSHVIIGHSERRTYHHESDSVINLKLKAAIKASLTPILCIGETLEERDLGLIEQVLERQLRGALSEIAPEEFSSAVVAYEPVWAIGTGRTATPDQAQEAHAFVRQTIGSILGADLAASLRIQYGGSAKPSNMAELIALPDVDGALVGGASLVAESFAEMVIACHNQATS